MDKEEWDDMYGRICKAADSVSNWAEHIYPYREMITCYDRDILEQAVSSLDLLATMMSFIANRAQDREDVLKDPWTRAAADFADPMDMVKVVGAEMVWKAEKSGTFYDGAEMVEAIEKAFGIDWNDTEEDEDTEDWE